MKKTTTQLKKHFETWAKEHGLEVFYTLDTEALPSTIYGTDSAHDHAAFEKLILKSGAPFIIVAITDVTIELGMYREDPEWFSENDEDYKEHVAFLKSKANDIASLEVGYIYQGIYFYQYIEADWIDDYEFIQAVCYSYDGDLGEDETDDIDLGGLLN